jgi:hypothetical protein
MGWETRRTSRASWQSGWRAASKIRRSLALPSGGEAGVLFGFERSRDFPRRAPFLKVFSSSLQLPSILRT